MTDCYATETRQEVSANFLYRFYIKDGYSLLPYVQPMLIEYPHIHVIQINCKLTLDARCTLGFTRDGRALSFNSYAESSRQNRYLAKITSLFNRSWPFAK